MADCPEDLVKEIDGVLRELDALPPDLDGGRPFDALPLAHHMDDKDRQRERWQWHFATVLEKLNWHYRNSTEFRELEMMRGSSPAERTMISAAFVLARPGKNQRAAFGGDRVPTSVN